MFKIRIIFCHGTFPVDPGPLPVVTARWRSLAPALTLCAETRGAAGRRMILIFLLDRYYRFTERPRALLLHTAEHCQHRRLCMRLLREMLVFGLKRTWNGCQLFSAKMQNVTKWHWWPIFESVRWPYKMCIMLHIAQGLLLSSIRTSLGSGDTNCRLLVADLSWFLGWVIMWDVRVWGNCDVVWAAGNWI